MACDDNKDPEEQMPMISDSDTDSCNVVVNITNDLPTYTGINIDEASAFDNNDVEFQRPLVSTSDSDCCITKADIKNNKSSYASVKQNENCISYLDRRSLQMLTFDDAEEIKSSFSNNVSLSSSMNSIKAQNNLRPSDSFESISSKEEDMELTKVSDNKFQCKLCNVFLSGADNCEQHLNSIRHLGEMCKLWVGNHTRASKQLNSKEKVVHSDNKDAEKQTPLTCKRNADPSNAKVVVKNDQHTHAGTKKVEVFDFDHLRKKANGIFDCNICKVSVGNDANCISHLNGRNHQAQLLLFNNTKVVNYKTNTSESINSSMDSVELQNNLSPCSFESITSEEDTTSNKLSYCSSMNMYIKQVSDTKFQCTACNTFISGEDNCELHLKGKRHMSNILIETATKASEQLISEERTAHNDKKNTQIQISTTCNSDVDSSNTKVIVSNNQPTCTGTDKDENFDSDHLEKKANGIFYCNICKVSIGSDANCSSHLNGRNHQTQLLLFNNTKIVHYTTNTSKSIKSSMGTVELQNNLHPSGSFESITSEEDNTSNNLSYSSPITMYTKKVSDTKFQCTACNTFIDGEYNYELHLKGRRHMSNISEINQKKASEQPNFDERMVHGDNKDTEMQTPLTCKRDIDSSNTKVVVKNDQCTYAGTNKVKASDFNHLEKKSNGTFYCNICKVSIGSNLNGISHLNLRNHQKQLSIFNNTKTVNYKTNTSKSINSNMDSVKRTKNLRPSGSFESITSEEDTTSDSLSYSSPMNLYIKKVSDYNFQCTICNIFINGKVNCEQHLKGRRHMHNISEINQKRVSGQLNSKEKVVHSDNKDDGKQTPLTCKRNVDSSNAKVVVKNDQHIFSGTKKVKAFDSDHLEKKANGIFYCNICKVSIGSDANCNSHLNGRNHKTQLLIFNNTKIGNYKTNTSESINSSIDSVELQNKLRPSDYFESITSEEDTTSNKLSYSSPMTMYIKKVSDNKFQCTACNTFINGEENCELHLKGRKHTSKILVVNATKASEQLNSEGRTVHNNNKNTHQIQTSSTCKSDVNFSSTEVIARNDQPTCIGTDKDEAFDFDYLEKKSNGIFYCDICTVSIEGEENYISHLDGENHQIQLLIDNMTKRVDTLIIEGLCSQSSMGGVNLQNNLRSFDSFESITSEEDATSNNLSCSSPMDTHIKKVPEVEFYCKPCNAFISSECNCELHLKSKRYKSDTLADCNVRESEPLSYTEKTVNNDNKNAEVQTPLVSEGDTDSDNPKVVVKNDQHTYAGTNDVEAPDFGQLEKTSNGTFYCNICKVSITGEENRIPHLNGIYHKIQLSIFNNIEIVNHKTNRSESINSSTDSVELQNNLSPSGSFESITSEEDVTSNNLRGSSPMNMDIKKVSDTKYHCTVCNTFISNEFDYKRHSKGIRHLYKAVVNRTRASEQLNSEEKTVDSDNKDIEMQTPLTCKSDVDSSNAKVVVKNDQYTCAGTNEVEDSDLNFVEKMSNGIFYCNICKKKIGGEENRIPHIHGKKHQLRKVIFANTPKGKIKSKCISLRHEVQMLLDSTTDIQPYINKADIQDQDTIANVDDNIQFAEKLNTESPNKLKKSNNCADEFDWMIPEDIYTELYSLTKNLYKTKPGAKPSKNNLPMLARTEKKGKSVAVICNQRYDTCLYVFEEKAFNCDVEHILNIEHSAKLSVNIQGDNRKCLLCKIKFPDNINYFYDHVHSAEHKQNLRSIESNYKLNKSFSQEMTNWELLEKGLRITPVNSIECLLCACQIKNDEDEIKIHVLKKDHKKKETKWKMESTRFQEYVMSELRDYWYSIQWFSCVVCNVSFDLKISFVQHLQEKHKKILEYSSDLLFDFCIPCASLWLGYKDTYAQHCTYIMHKRLIQNNDFGVSSMPVLAKDLLDHVSENVSKFRILSETVSTDTEEQKNMTNALEETFRPKYPKIKAYTFGSRFNGLGLPNSDIDIYIDMGNTYYLKGSKEEQLVYLNEVERQLLKKKDEWKILDVLKKSRTPIIKLEYRPTGIKCDISFTNGLSVENTKLLRTYNEAFLNCRLLILFLKRWLSLCYLSGAKNVTNYALAWLVIFYLQKQSILPSVATLIKEANKKQYISGWEVGDNYNIRVDPKHQNSDFKELLLGFFNFYAHFDFRYEIVCPLLGDSVLKRTFANEDTLPDEMKSYKIHLTTSNDPEFFRIDSCMCVQDPLDLSHNLTKGVRNLTLKSFKQYCLESATIISSDKSSNCV